MQFALIPMVAVNRCSTDAGSVEAGLGRSIAWRRVRGACGPSIPKSETELPFGKNLHNAEAFSARDLALASQCLQAQPTLKCGP